MFSFAAFLKAPNKRIYAHPGGYNGEGPLKQRRIHDKEEEDPTTVGLLHTWRPPAASSSADEEEPVLIGAIKLQSRAEGLDYAHAVLKLEDSKPKTEEGPVYLTFFVDGSIGETDRGYAGSPGAYSVVFRDPEDGQWVEQSWFVEQMFNNNWGELVAIAEALNMATLHLRLQPATAAVATIHIFSDSKLGLGYLERNTPAKRILYELAMAPVRAHIKRLAHELHQLGARVVLSHIAGHDHDVSGHAVADNAAYRTFSTGVKALNALLAQRRQALSGPGSTPAASAPRPSRRSLDRDTAFTYRSRETKQHHGIWAVLQGFGAKAIAAYRRDHQPTKEEAEKVERLKALLEKGRAGQSRKAWKLEVGLWKDQVAQFL